MATRYLVANIENIRKVKAECTAARFKWASEKKSVLCDLFTASAIIAVYDALNDENKAKVERMVAASPMLFSKVAGFCFEHVK